MNIRSKLEAVGFECEALPGGYTWTLTTILGKLLAAAEKRYGPRDYRWTLLSIEFSNDGPQTWYPGERFHVAIQLSLNARNEPDRAIWQIAQEVIHLLSPTGKPSSANMLEEGIATVFAETIAADYGLSRFTNYLWDGHYKTAAELVQQLLEVDPNAVRRLRESQPCVSAVDAGLITSFYPALSPKLATALCEKFRESRHPR